MPSCATGCSSSRRATSRGSSRASTPALQRRSSSSIGSWPARGREAVAEGHGSRWRAMLNRSNDCGFARYLPRQPLRRTRFSYHFRSDAGNSRLVAEHLKRIKYYELVQLEFDRSERV
eukprot:4615466-Prymnesium_polylepis.1